MYLSWRGRHRVLRPDSDWTRSSSCSRPAGGGISTCFQQRAFRDELLKCQQCLERLEEGGERKVGGPGDTTAPRACSPTTAVRRYWLLFKVVRAGARYKSRRQGFRLQPARRLIPRRGRSSHPSQFPKHMCAEQEINQRSSSASQNNLGVNLLPPPPLPFLLLFYFFIFFYKQDLYHVRHWISHP